MGIILDGSDGQPFELLIQRAPTAHCEGEFVVVTMPAFAAGFPEATADIQVRMSSEHAAAMAVALNQAVMRTWRREP